MLRLGSMVMGLPQAERNWPLPINAYIMQLLTL
jgi:hypothetical protein